MRFLLLAIAVVDLLVFSRLTGLSILASALGSVMILLGIAYNYRLASALGLLVISVGAGASITITTLTDVSTVLTAFLGLLLPLFLLAYIALSADEGEAPPPLARRPILVSVGYMTGCILSAPVAILLLGVLTPGVALRVVTMTEMGIVLVTATTLGIVLSYREPRKSVAFVSEELP
jgi:hypothetical protein